MTARDSSRAPDLAALQHLAELLVGRGATGGASAYGGAPPAAIIPCQLADDHVAVVAWAIDGDSIDYELVALSGDAIDDEASMREALTLIAMAESLAELADAEAVRPLADALHHWLDLADGVEHPSLESLRPSVQEARTVLVRLAAAGDHEVVVASTDLLDRFGSLARDMESAWQRLEQQVELEAAALYESHSELVEQLWSALSQGRRGVLAQPVTVVIEQGRRAGMALADEVLGGPHGHATHA